MLSSKLGGIQPCTSRVPPGATAHAGPTKRGPYCSWANLSIKCKCHQLSRSRLPAASSTPLHTASRVPSSLRLRRLQHLPHSHKSAIIQWRISTYSGHVMDFRLSAQEERVIREELMWYPTIRRASAGRA